MSHFIGCVHEATWMPTDFECRCFYNYHSRLQLATGLPVLYSRHSPLEGHAARLGDDCSEAGIF